jgi:serine/threonine-protein kinase RsbW
MSSVSAVFVNDRAEIQRLAELAERFGADNGLSDEEVMAINLALDEVVANIIEYGFDDAARHDIHVMLALDGGALTIEVDDDARPFDPLAAPGPDLTLPLEDRPVGGLGIHIVRSVMDAVEYQRRDGRNVLTMRKTIGRP